jgi:hypothetical protein
MKYSQENVGGVTVILANDHYVGIPASLDFSDVATTVDGKKTVKAGSPMKSAANGWVVSNDADAEGILLWNVNEDRPIGTIVTHGTINKSKAETSFGASYSSVSINGITLV